jgi:hypothetical protein
MRLLDSDAVDSAPQVELGRIAWAGPLTVLTSLAAVHLVRQIVLRLPHIQLGSPALRMVPVTADTVILCSIAVVVFTLVSAFNDDGVRRFRWIAVGALLASFLPLVQAHGIADVPTAFGIGALHVAAYVPCVTLLPWAVMPKAAGIHLPRK